MENNLYITRDLAESAALIVNKQRCLDMRKIGKIYWFYFEDQKKCTEISKEYFFGNLLVNAREFHQTINRLKNRIFAER